MSRFSRLSAVHAAAAAVAATLRTDALFARPLFDDPAGDAGGHGLGSAAAPPPPADPAANPPAHAAPAPPAGQSFAALREEWNVTRRQIDATFTTAARENRPTTAEENAANETRLQRLEAIQRTLNDQARFARLALEQPNPAAGTVTTAAPNPPGREQFSQQQQQQQGQQQSPLGGSPGNPANVQQGQNQAFAFAGQRDAAQHAAFCAALKSWAYTGDMDRRFATITTATQSSVYLPREISAPIIPMASNAIRDAIAIQGMQTITLVTTSTTADMTVPVVSGSAGGAVAQNASSETENTPSLSESILLNVATYQSGSVWYSNQVLQAGTIDVVNDVVPTLMYEKELGLESAIVAAMIADAGITQSEATTSISAISYDDLVNLNRKLPRRFDTKKVILLSDEAYTAAEKLVGDDGHPILNRDPQNQELLRFNGTPVLRCSYLEAFGANKVVGMVISLLGFRLRDVSGANLARYTQQPAKPNQTGMNLFAYHGFGYAVSAVAKLKCPAS